MRRELVGAPAQVAVVQQRSVSDDDALGVPCATGRELRRHQQHQTREAALRSLQTLWHSVVSPRLLSTRLPTPSRVDPTVSVPEGTLGGAEKGSETLHRRPHPAVA